MAAIHRIEQHNAEVAEPCSAIAWRWSRSTRSPAGPAVAYPLGSDYRAAMRACTRLQAVGDKGRPARWNSASEAALDRTRGRRDQRRSVPSDKLVVLVSGSPADRTRIQRADRRVRAKRPANCFYPGDAYPANAALCRRCESPRPAERLYPVGVGPRCDVDCSRLAGPERRPTATASPESAARPGRLRSDAGRAIDHALEEASPRIVQ